MLFKTFVFGVQHEMFDTAFEVVVLSQSAASYNERQTVSGHFAHLTVRERITRVTNVQLGGDGTGNWLE